MHVPDGEYTDDMGVMERRTDPEVVTKHIGDWMADEEYHVRLEHPERDGRYIGGTMKACDREDGKSRGLHQGHGCGNPW